VNETDTAHTLLGRKQCDEDDYGYVSNNSTLSGIGSGSSYEVNYKNIFFQCGGIGFVFFLLQF